MNENNINTTQPDLKVISYKIVSNKDKENTYSIEIETSVHTIVYPKANVVFGATQAIAFPVGIQVLNNEDNILFNYALNLQQNEESKVVE